MQAYHLSINGAEPIGAWTASAVLAKKMPRSSIQPAAGAVMMRLMVSVVDAAGQLETGLEGSHEDESPGICSCFNDVGNEFSQR
jgi:hypothetical protein